MGWCGQERTTKEHMDNFGGDHYLGCGDGFNGIYNTSKFKLYTLNILREFPLCLTELQTRLVTMRIQVQSLALLSELWNWHCHELWYRSKTQLRSQVAVAVV